MRISEPANPHHHHHEQGFLQEVSALQGRCWRPADTRDPIPGILTAGSAASGASRTARGLVGQQINQNLKTCGIATQPAATVTPEASVIEVPLMQPPIIETVYRTLKVGVLRAQTGYKTL